MKLEELYRIRLELNGAKIAPKNMEDEGLEGACWEGYEPIGMKEKDGKMVPNCVPIKENQSKIKKEGFPIPSPSGDEDEQKYISRCIGEIIGEYDVEGQAYAVCKSKWDER
jgi:hypothetical protein